MRDVWTGGRPEEKREQPPGRRLILEDLDLPGRRIETPLAVSYTHLRAHET